MSIEATPPARSLSLPIVIFGSLGMAFAWVLTPSYGPWVANAAVAIPTLLAAFIWGETARSLQLGLRASALAVAIGLALVFASWLLAGPLVRAFPWLGRELTQLYATLNRPPGPLKALPILLLTAATEEVVWRGELVSWLRLRCGSALTVIIATFAYSLPIAASQSPLLFAVASGLGAVFTLERLLTNSWVAPLITHAIWAVGVFVAQPPLQ